MFVSLTINCDWQLNIHLRYFHAKFIARRSLFNCGQCNRLGIFLSCLVETVVWRCQVISRCFSFVLSIINLNSSDFTICFCCHNRLLRKTPALIMLRWNFVIWCVTSLLRLMKLLICQIMISHFLSLCFEIECLVRWIAICFGNKHARGSDVTLFNNAR